MDDQILFWTKLAAIGQLAGAVATATAVIVSLWVVLSERAAKVTATAGLRMLVGGVGLPAEDVIAIEVTNMGQRPLRVSSIGWRSGWLRTLGPKWARYRYAIQTSSRRRDSHDPPFALEPGENRTMLIDVAPFRGDQKITRNHELFARTLPVFGLIPANIKCSIHIVGAGTKHFNVEKDLGSFFLTGAGGGAEKFNDL